MHVVPPAQVALTAVAVDALVESVCGEPPPVVNVVDVIVTFQPVPEPVASFTVIGSVYVGVWSVPSSVAATLGVALVDRLSVPAASSPPTAVKLFNAAANTGMGSFNLTPTIQVAIPANTYAGTYQSTVTVAIVSGP